MDRREFLKITSAAGILAGGIRVSAQDQPKDQGAAGRTAPKLETVRVGFIGVGARGSGHVAQLLKIEGVQVKAICDTNEKAAEQSAKACPENPELYTKGDEDYKRMLERPDLDAVFISTPWEWHVRMTVDTLKAGKHAFVEVPMATTLDDCWQVVDAAEKSDRHCMMMENCCYGREELLVLNMVRQGVFGELLHGEAAYIHDLREQMNEVDHGTGSWRTCHYAQRNGNLYPTHGLGPVAQYMNINRGDRLDFLCSVGSPSMTRAIYAKEHFPPDHKWNKLQFVCGDINTSIVKTVRGRTIMIQWDENCPRPYTRHNFIQGTRGCWGGFPDRVVIEGQSPSTHEWESGARKLAKYYEKYEHPLWKRMGELAKKNGGHGGMDFLMLWRIVYCLRNGLALDQDVYDGATWSVIGPLSEDSVAHRGRSTDVPDFTRGRWKTIKPLGIVE